MAALPIQHVVLSYNVGQRIDLYQYLRRCHPKIRVNVIHLITMILAAGAKKIPQIYVDIKSKESGGDWGCS